mmetsp:Transcript_25079/g.58218  ORF Transcript_25079/g.58218 Transcript_25079/m.58218 type:complete len:411 (+) Transcript_25079:130-1362(+)
MDADQVKALKAAVDLLKEDPTLVYGPDLTFFKEFLLSWGAKVPTAGAKAEPKASEAPPPPKAEEPKVEEAEEEEEEEEEEPVEPEEEDPERLPEDPEPFPSKGPEGEVELTDEQMDKQAAAKQAAAEALEDGDTAKALEKYTEAIAIGGATAMMFAKRAELLLKMKKPCACIADCDAALKINPDSAKAYRTRGKAHRKLGHWEEAHKDISMGQQLDYDDDTVEVQKFVAEKHKKYEERRTRQRLKEEAKAKKQKEKELKRRQEAAAKARAEYEAQKEAERSGGGGFPGMGGFPGGFPGMGGMGGMPGMPGGIPPELLQGLMSDPDLMQAFSNPKFMTAMQDIMSNPGNIGKYQSDPEIMALIQKVMGKMGGMGGMGGMFGGAGGPGAGDAGGAESTGPTVEEVPDADEVD